MAGNNVLCSTAQGILLVIVRGTDETLKTVTLHIVLVPDLKRNIFSSTAAAEKGVKTIFEQNDSSLDLRLVEYLFAFVDNYYLVRVHRMAYTRSGMTTAPY